MKDVIKNIIKDFHKVKLPEYVKRELNVPVNTNKIISIIGGRRTGKTYYLYQLIENLLQTVKREDIIYINFEDERLNLKADDLHFIIEAYYELYPHNKNPLYFFFDEIQNIKNWEKFVRRIYDTISKNIIITGSSSKLLSGEIATSLRGRSISYELFPLNFKEYLRFMAIDSDDIYSTKNKSLIFSSFHDYLYWGGYPETVNYNNELKIKTMQSYLDVMIYRDIIERYEIKNPTALKYFIKKCLANVSNYLSVNKLYNELKSMGIKIGKDTIYDFINYVHDCYLIFLVNIYSESINVQNTNEKKLYCIDNGIVNSVSFKFSENIGRMLENMVFLQLLNKGNSVYYFSDKKECDFVVLKKGKIVEAYQVTYELSELNRSREVDGLLEAMNYFDLKEGFILTMDQSEEFEVKKKRIKVMPVWKWMLEGSGLD